MAVTDVPVVYWNLSGVCENAWTLMCWKYMFTRDEPRAPLLRALRPLPPFDPFDSYRDPCSGPSLSFQILRRESLYTALLYMALYLRD